MSRVLVRLAGTTAALLIMVFAIFFIKWRLEPLFAIPEEVVKTPAEHSVQSILDQWTGHDGLFRTVAFASDLTKSRLTKKKLAGIRERWFPNVEFYRVALKTEHLLNNNRVNAPFSKFTVAADKLTGKTWVLVEVSKFKPAELSDFLQTQSFSVHDEADATILWLLVQCVIPLIPTNADHVRITDREWSLGIGSDFVGKNVLRVTLNEAGVVTNIARE